MSESETLRDNQAACLKALAEKVYPHVDKEASEFDHHMNNSGRANFNPLLGNGDTWKLMQAYRDALKPMVAKFEGRSKHNGRWENAGGRIIFNALESPESLVLAAMELWNIKV